MASYRPFEIHRRVFGPRQCAAIVSLGLSLDRERAGLHAPRGTTPPGRTDRVRDADTAWIPRDRDSEWIYARLARLAHSANRRYGFDLDGFVEDLQFTVYDRAGAFYTWHQDGLDGTVRHRKLSIVVQLSDPGDYSGGQLELFEVDADYDDVQKRDFYERCAGIGTAVVFPSFEFHRVLPLRSGVRRSLVCWIGGRPFR